MVDFQHTPPSISSLQWLYEKIKPLKHSSPLIDADIAQVMGWQDIFYCEKDKQYKGMAPHKWSLEPIPLYTKTVDGAATLIPEHWVEGYNRQFDNTSVGECYPRPDLGKTAIELEEGASPAIAIVLVGLLAQIQMLQ